MLIVIILIIDKIINVQIRIYIITAIGIPYIHHPIIRCGHTRISDEWIEAAKQRYQRENSNSTYCVFAL